MPYTTTPFYPVTKKISLQLQSTSELSAIARYFRNIILDLGQIGKISVWYIFATGFQIFIYRAFVDINISYVSNNNALDLHVMFFILY